MIEKCKSAPNSFANKYHMSTDEYRKIVDGHIGHLYDYYGGKKFLPILTDIANKRKSYIDYTIHDFIDLYNQNYKKFSTLINISRIAKVGIKREMYLALRNLIGDLIDEYDHKFGHIFYDIVNPDHKNKICKMCDNLVKFNYTKTEYSNYCCVKCARKDPTRISDEQKKIGTEKRNAKMKELLDDPIRRKEYRDKIYESVMKTVTPESRLLSSKRMKKKILDGEFTPNITNTWNHWSACVGDKKFRSRFEAIFYAHCLENDIPVEFETLRIPYSYNGSNKIYLVDFVNRRDKIAYEIKPSNQITDEVVVAKELAAKSWCSQNGYTFTYITEIDLKEFSGKMTKMRHLVEDYLKVYKW